MCRKRQGGNIDREVGRKGRNEKEGKKERNKGREGGSKREI